MKIITPFILLYIFISGPIASALPLHVDIRDTLRSQLRLNHSINELFTQTYDHDYDLFNCDHLEIISYKHLCELSNQLILDNNDVFIKDKVKLFSFQLGNEEKSLFYNYHSPNKYKNILSSQNITTSFVLRNYNEAEVSFEILAFIHHQNEMYYQIINFQQFNENFVAINSSKVHKLYENFDLHLEVGLLDLAVKMKIEHQGNTLYKIMPITAPGFSYDEKHLRSLKINTTFYLSNSYHLKGTHSESTKNRNHPEYYDGLPFIKILNENFDYNAFGFHGTLYNRPLERGYLSTGCYRLAPKDIIEVYYIFASLGEKTGTTITKKNIEGLAFHPQTTYKTSFWKASFPDHRKGEDNLTAMKEVLWSKPPIDQLTW